VGDLDHVLEIKKDLPTRTRIPYKFRVISQDKAGLQKRQIPIESIFQRSDLLRFGLRGALIGGTVGAVVIIALSLAGFTWPLGAWVALFLFSLFAGTAGSGFGGITAHHVHIRPHINDLEQGLHLVMIDVPKGKVEAMQDVMARHYPNAKLRAKDEADVSPLETTDEEPDSPLAAIDNPDNRAGAPKEPPKVQHTDNR
ncbi:MAG: hypothetical protein WED11_09365, partial [Natronospirillum sp.]